MTPHGYGTIYQRESDGRWIAAVDLPSERGERKRKTFSGWTQEDVAAKLKAFRLANPATEHVGRKVNVRRAKEQGSHTDKEWWALVRLAERRCYYCNIETVADLDKKFHRLATQKDHLVPVSRGGSNAIENVVVSCRTCNQAKGTMTADEFFEWRDRHAQA